MVRVVVLGSGRGSNARALLQAHVDDGLGLASISGVFTDVSDAPILQLGPQFEVPAFYLEPGPYRTKLTGEAEQHWIEVISMLNPDLVVLAGFMRVVKPPFLEAFPRTLNLHPSLLPDFPGLNAIRRAWEARRPATGCTVHWVSSEVDAGQIIAQERVEIEPGMSLDELETQVHEAEHRLLPRVIKDLARQIYLEQLGR
ncbi:MAG: phosphoribosylglycinamide formyltransferase [Opitutales bacterium]